MRWLDFETLSQERKMKISLQRMTVKSRNLIGTVEENFNMIGSSFTVYDAIRNKLCNIYGPNVCSCCMYQEAQFQVRFNLNSHLLYIYLIYYL